MWVRRDEAQAVPEGRDGGVSAAEELARLRAENARLLKAEQEWQLEREILRRAAAYFAPGGEVSPRRWDFISENRADFGVKLPGARSVPRRLPPAPCHRAGPH